MPDAGSAPERSRASGPIWSRVRPSSIRAVVLGGERLTVDLLGLERPPCRGRSEPKWTLCRSSAGRAPRVQFDLPQRTVAMLDAVGKYPVGSKAGCEGSATRRLVC